MAKTTIKKIFALILTLALSLSLLVLFTSCADKSAGSGTLLSKEELQRNVESEATAEGGFADWLEEWRFPLFNKSKLELLESIYEKHYVSELPEAKVKAKECALYFLSKYYDSVEIENVEKTTDMIIKSYVATVNDRYSVYRTAEEYEEYDSDMSGSFVGIGVTVRYRESTEEIEVISVNRGGGAEEAGILSGDLIVKVDGKSVSELGYEDAVSMIRGEEGTNVLIGVLREGSELSFSVKRKTVTEESVRYLIENGIGYVKITSFKDNTYSQFKEAIDAIEASGAKGIIYDVRSNPGGYLHSVVDILDYIAPKGTTIASFTNDYAKPEKARTSHTVLLPSVVIFNGSTASAGELFASAIRDFGEMGLFPVKTVGEKSFGKGIMQNTYRFRDGASITLTVAYYNPPLGKNYHGVGIKPDVEIEGDSLQLASAYEEINKLINNN